MRARGCCSERWVSRLGGRSFRSAGSSLECVEWLRQRKRSSLTKSRAGDACLGQACAVLCCAVGGMQARQTRGSAAWLVAWLAGPFRPAPASHQPTNPLFGCPAHHPCLDRPVIPAGELASLGAQTLRCPSVSLRTSLRSHCRRTRPTTFNLEVSVMARRPMTTTTTIRGAEQQAVGEAQRIPSSRRWTRPPHNQRTPRPASPHSVRTLNEPDTRAVGIKVSWILVLCIDVLVPPPEEYQHHQLGLPVHWFP